MCGTFLQCARHRFGRGEIHIRYPQRRHVRRAEMPARPSCLTEWVPLRGMSLSKSMVNGLTFHAGCFVTRIIHYNPASRAGAACPPLKRRFDCRSQWRRRSADELAQLMTIVEQPAFGNARVGIGKQRGNRFRQSHFDQHVLVFGFGQIDVADVLAGLARNFCRQFGQCVRSVSPASS